MKNLLFLFIAVKLISTQALARDCNESDTLNSLVPGQTFITLSKDIDLYQPLLQKRTGHDDQLASNKVALFINGELEIVQDTKWNQMESQLATAQILSRSVTISAVFGDHKFKINKKYVLSKYDKNFGYIFIDVEDLNKIAAANMLLQKYGERPMDESALLKTNQIALKAERSALDLRRSAITIDSLKYNLGRHVKLETQCQ